MRLLLLAAVLWPVAAVAADPTGPQLHDAILTGLGDTLQATGVPVVTPGGGIVYRDVRITLKADDAGNLTMASPMTVSPTPQTLSAGFIPGNYAMAEKGFAAHVEGPGVKPGGVAEWSVASIRGACTYPFTASWQIGPLDVNPVGDRVAKAGIAHPGIAFGMIGGENCAHQPEQWQTGALIAVAQVGNSLTFTSYTDHNGDHATPTSEITYVRQ